MIFFLLFFFISVQFVVPGVTEADSKSIYYYYFWPNRTVDVNFSQIIDTCSHTDTHGVTEAWVIVDLQTVRSIKSVTFWYRDDGKHN